MSRLAQVVGIIGAEAAKQLCERLGGVRLYVPICPNTQLLLAIGRPAATKLCNAMGGEFLRMPSRTAQERASRREAILYDLRRGLAAHEIAIRHGVTDSHVHALRASQELPHA